MKTILVNPLDETPRQALKTAPRLASLAGKTVGLLDISKPGGSFFLDQLERTLRRGAGSARNETNLHKACAARSD